MRSHDSFLEFRSSIDFRLVLVALRSLCLGALYMLCDEFHLGSSKSFVEKKNDVQERVRKYFVDFNMAVGLIIL